jgi:hypothetical protein
MMKKVAFFVAVLTVLSCARVVPVVGQGALLPPIQQFHGSTSSLASGAKLCTIAAGTTTSWLATYSNRALSAALPNPITLNSLGRPTTNGSTVTPVYIQPLDYKLILYAAGTGNSCNGTTVGTKIWELDYQFDYGQEVESSLASGTYTPTATAILNGPITTVVAYPFTYTRIGDRVTVEGQINFDPFANAVTSVTLTLPVATIFSSTQRSWGLMTNLNGTTVVPVPIVSLMGTSTVYTVWTPGTSGALDFHVRFTYAVD